MELAQSKAVGVLHHHHRGVGHIHAHLNDRSRHQNLYLSPGKFPHHRLFLRPLHTPVEKTHLQIREHPLL